MMESYLSTKEVNMTISTHTGINFNQGKTLNFQFIPYKFQAMEKFLLFTAIIR